MLLFWFLFAHHGEGKKKPQHWICPIVMELSESVTRGEQARNKKERQKGDEKKKRKGYQQRAARSGRPRAHSRARRGPRSGTGSGTKGQRASRWV